MGEAAFTAYSHSYNRLRIPFVCFSLFSYPKTVNHLFQQYVMLKNAIREMGGYPADETID